VLVFRDPENIQLELFVDPGTRQPGPAAEARVAEPLVASCRYVPPLAHAAILVAGGDAEVAYQSSGGPWDFAALAVIVEAAGGRFSDLEGKPDISCGGPVVFTNGLVHDDVLRALGPTR